MATGTTPFSLVFPEYYDSQGEAETPLKGYLADVVVQLENGARYSLFFYDPVRLEQELKAENETGRAYLAEPNMIVVPEVNTETFRKAVDGLYHDGFFEHLKPL